MKILFVNTVPLEANGISTFIINSAKGLSRLGASVTILASNQINVGLINELKKYNIKLVIIPNRNKKPITYFFKLRKMCLDKKYDVIHVNGNSTTMALELWAARSAKVKLRIAHSHNTTTEHPVINRILRPFFDLSVNGRIACNIAAGKWLFKKRSFEVIKNGIDLGKYKYSENIRSKVRKELNISDEEILLGNVGNFNFQKNQQFLIKLLAQLSAKNKLVLIGEGKTLNQVKKLSINLKVDKRVYFLGVKDNVQDYLNAIDLFLLPSNFEGQPFVLIEAAASGLRSVVSDKVPYESNICDNTTFLKLNNYNLWLNEIETFKKNDRNKTTRNYAKLLTIHGYDTQKNAYKLLKYYKEKQK